MRLQQSIYLTFYTLFIYTLFSCTHSANENPLLAENLRLFDWMVLTFEENDAGFKFHMEEKGKEAYAKHIEQYREKAKTAKNEYEFGLIANEWLMFFRKGHIGVYPKNNILSTITEEEKEKIRSKYHDEEKVNYTENNFRSYLLTHKEKLHPLEGIWRLSEYTLGVIRSEKSPKHFDTFIINADSIYWLPQQKKAEITLREDNRFDINISNKLHIKEKHTAQWLGSSQRILLQDERLFWIKIFPETQSSPQEIQYIKLLTERKPFLTVLSQQTLYLRIPSFLLKYKKDIDELLIQNDALIKATPNLIIDIRYGTGGSDASHSGLTPYYYTQPIRLPNQLYWATEQNASYYEYCATLHDNTKIAKHNQSIANKMRKNIGSYIDEGKDTYVYSGYPLLRYPEKIAIVCNKYNASADESLLYKTRQSYKVKIFGQSTSGALDFSNVNIIDFPSKKYSLQLWITVTANKRRIEGYQIDNIGIQPDFYIDNNICEEEWINYVQSIIERKG